MAALTDKTPTTDDGLCETIAITNQTAASTAVSRFVNVPSWARYATFVVNMTSMGGTNPTFDFTVRGAYGLAVPDSADVFPLLGAGWDGITQQTTAHVSTVHIGPDITTDDSGSATAADAYGVGAPLPKRLVYTYTTTDSADDADYAGTISVFFRAQ